MSELTVMSYNIGHYNMGLAKHGFPADVLDEKLTNLKEMYMEYGPDLIGIQEEEQYLDQAKTMKAATTLYSPVWRFRQGYKCNSIRAKYKCVGESYELIQFSNGMNFRRGIFNVDGKRVLMISAHTTHGSGNNAAREVQYQELFEHIRNTQYDACIVTGDFNTTDPLDKQNLTALCEENGFDMAIGSYLPWVDTYLGRTATARHHSFDNILVSCGEIRRVKVLREWYERLYSDHVPVVTEVRI